MSVDSRHAFQILDHLGQEADRLGVRVVDMHGKPGSVAEFLDKIALYITARENEADQLREAIMGATLTDAEREAVDAMAQWCEVDAGHCGDAGELEAQQHYAARAATLRGLLERL